MERRISIAALICACLIGGSAIATAQEHGAAGLAIGSTLAKGKKGKHVHKAWPHKQNGKKPHKRLARKLAKQVGPVKVRKHRRGMQPAALRPSTRATTPPSPDIVGTTEGSSNKLLLVRSFDIPKDDPLYADLTNYSWTYDNALATLGFVADKDRSQARQLLDQLAVLQNKSGSFNFAFDVATGASSEVVRSGAVAWVGLAGAAFAAKYGDKSYDAMITGTVDYLLGRRTVSGLITGGPDVSWVSTQHNLLASELLRELAELAKHSHRFGPYTDASLTAARQSLDTAIAKHLLVSDGTSAYFREGQADDRIPIDVQALGAMYLEINDDPRAEQVGATILRPGFYVPARSTTAAPTKVSGLKPFLDPGSPNLIWSEGTIQSQFALTRLGQPKTYVDESVKSLAATMKPDTVGPIGADRRSDTTWGQYQTWPTSAAASWLLMLQLEGDVVLFD